MNPTGGMNQIIMSGNNYYLQKQGHLVVGRIITAQHQLEAGRVITSWSLTGASPPGTAPDILLAALFTVAEFPDEIWV